MFVSQLFYILLFSVPLILYPYTSELFEFNKIITVYFFTASIMAAWVVRAILEKKIIFRRTIFDKPLLFLLGSQLLATIFSIDIHTSIFGYYSRFNGGLLSVLSFSLLYWAFVSNMDRQKTISSIKILLFSSIFVSAYAVLERFGIDKNIWVQDVQNRVFSTLGQPNWLAAWLVALFPFMWVFILKTKEKSLKFWFWEGVFILGFFAFLFTKSRSGILGLLTASAIFWTIYIAQKGLPAGGQGAAKLSLNKFAWIAVPAVLIATVIGTPWTPGLSNLLKQEPATSYQLPATNATALETGGTESGLIRKIVWRGAFEIWKHHPLFGTGPETFAFSYYNYRPAEHNLTSEWDFLYNKAHNEYLNYLANTGIVGFSAYLYFIFIFVFFILKKYPKIKSWRLALLSGFVSILATNFFGFSVVPISILFFLFPAMAVTLVAGSMQNVARTETQKLLPMQKFLLISILLATCYLLLLISRYWYADTLYAKGKSENRAGNYVEASKSLAKAVKISSYEGVYWDELSDSMAQIAVTLDSPDFAQKAIDYSNFALNLSPRNLNFIRGQASTYLKLSTINPDYLHDAQVALEKAATLAPTDAKIFYNLGLTLVREGKADEATGVFEKTINLKPDYRDARLALALTLIDKRDYAKAKEQLNYILEKISPDDPLVVQQLEEIKAK